MKRMSTLFGVLLVVAAIASCVVAASASAAKVPGFLLLSGESGTLTFSGSSTAATELQSAAGTLTGVGVKLNISLVTDDEGTYTADFEKVINKEKENCATLGDGGGTVLVPNNKVRTVHDITSTTGNGLLFEVSPEFLITCGKETIHVKGTDLGLFEGVGAKEGNDFNAFAGLLFCKNLNGAGVNGEPFEEKFWGLSGVEEKAKLEANFGTGAKKACELVGTVAAATKVELKSNKMAELMEVGS